MHLLRGAFPLICVALVGCAREHGPPGGGMPPPRTPEVLVGQPVRKDIMDYEECTGRTEAFKTVEIRARVHPVERRGQGVDVGSVPCGEFCQVGDVRGRGCRGGASPRSPAARATTRLPRP